MLFVQAGMNDIDQRCDAYLQWLDARRRFSTAAMQQISDTRTATEAIMGFTGANVKAISVVGAAFGFAAQTFTNLNTRLLLQVNQATVQSLVLTRQREYREDIRKRLVDSRPMALHALRSYLRPCMPMTIETEINVTVTALERSSTVPDRMISAATVAPAIINDPRKRLPKGNGLTEEQEVERRRVVLEAALCVPSTGQSLDDASREFLVGRGVLDPKEKSIPSTNEMRDLLDRARARPACKNSNYVSAFEVGRFGVAPRTREAERKDVMGLQNDLRTFLGRSDKDLPSSGSLDKGTREAIRVAREKLGLAAGNHVNFEFLMQLAIALKNPKKT